MHRLKRMNDSVHWFMGELTARIVAETGIPSDRFHLGKIILRSLKDAPDFVSQINGATGQSETNASVLERSVRCATSFGNIGLQKGDVIILMAPNHLDLCIPYYAALYSGVIIAPIDMTLTGSELQDIFETDEPKIIFCQSEKLVDVQSALMKKNLEAQIVTFDETANENGNVLSFSEFLVKYGKDSSVDEFKAADFDPDDTTAFIAATSGTTGLPKQAALTHKQFAIMAPYKMFRSTNFPCPTRMALVTSPLQWMSAIMQFNISPIMRFTRLQSPLPMTQQHIYSLINTYKPTFKLISPNLMTILLRPGDRDKCDFTCFENIFIGGSTVPHSLVEEMKQIMPKAEVFPVYGATEVVTYFVFHSDYPPPGSLGKPLGFFEYRLVTVDKEEDILEPNIQGELWLKGPGTFKGYYKNPVATRDAFSEDGWFKTGDLFYRDDAWNFYFVERIKMLLKYNNHQVSPVEVENVIRQHPGVLDVAVSGVPDPECGDLIVACVVRRAGHSVTAQDIKDVVKESLTDSKQLRGGVIFVSEIPMTASTKINGRKLKEMVLRMGRE